MKIIEKLKHELRNQLLFVWICAFMDIIGLSILNPFLARILLDLGAPIAQIGLLLSINTFIGFFSGIFWGALSDKYGRRPILLICRFGTLAGYVLLAFSTNITMLVFSRIIDGIFSRNVQVTLTIVGDVVPPHHRSKQMSNAGAAWILGGLIGPGIGALLSVHGVFGLGLFNAGLAAAAFLITLFTLKESFSRNTGNLPVSESPYQNRKPIFSFGLLHEHEPRLLLGQSLFNTLAHFIFSFSIALFVTKQFNFSIAQIGLMLTFVGVINFLVRIFIFPPTLRKLGDRKILMLGFFVNLIAFTWLIFVSHVWEFISVSILISFGTTCSMDVMNGVMSKVVKKHEMGAMIGLNSAVESISLVLGPIIGSYLISLSNSAFFGLVAAAVSIIPILLSVIPLKKEL